MNGATADELTERERLRRQRISEALTGRKVTLETRRKMSAVRRGHDAPKGEQCGRSKLTEEQVREIRKLYEAGATQGELGEQYGVSANAIWKIVHRQSWGHVE